MSNESVGRFVWHEQVSSDPKEAERFYTQLFGWGTEVYRAGETDYTMISSGEQSHGAYARAMEGAPPPHWLGHVRVEDLDQTVENATSSGGSVLAGPFEMEEIGRFAIVADPQGAFVSVYQPTGDAPQPQGVFVWDELGTSDVDSAQRFYEQVFGWTATDLGEEFGGYRIFNVGETGFAGLMGLQDDSSSPRWQPYVYVGDPDATVAKAGELGGSVVYEPMDVPNTGRIAALRDPQGASFGIIRPEAGA